MKNYRMDRTSVSKSSFTEADDHVTYFKKKTPLERLNNACFIINQIFQVTSNSKVKRTLVQSRKNA